MQFLNYHHLFYFYTIAKEGSVTKATKKLRLAQSTLSTQLLQFEEQLGHKLFDRSGKSLILNEMGRQVFSYAHEIFALGSELHDMIGDRRRPGTLQIQVGILDSIPKIVSESLLDFVLEDENVSIQLEESTHELLFEKLLDHRIDLLISDRKPDHRTNSDIAVKQLLEMDYYFAAHKRFKYSELEEAVLDGRFVFLGPHDGGREKFNELREKLGGKAKVVAEIYDAEIHHRYVIKGKAIGNIPEFLLKQNPTLTKLMEAPAYRETIWLVSRHRKLPNPMAQKIWTDFQMSSKID